MRRILITTAAIGALAFAFYASSTGRATFSDRFGAAEWKSQEPIPYQKLHDRALEILRERPMPPVVAETVPLPKPDPRK
jgi:hypothetical protein